MCLGGKICLAQLDMMVPRAGDVYDDFCFIYFWCIIQSSKMNYKSLGTELCKIL